MNTAAASPAPYFQGALAPFLTPPDGWAWDSFTFDGHNIRYGRVCPETPPKAIVIALQGLSEFTEKYFETARDILDRGMCFYMMDWIGQGKSSRLLGNKHKRHSLSFDTDLDSFHEFVTRHVLPAHAPGTPVILLGHSMGGNLALRYTAAHPEIVSFTATSAPMIGIHAVQTLPVWIQKALSSVLNRFLRETYVFGGGDWAETARPNVPESLFSADPVRQKLHNEWCLYDQDLQVGNITFGWIYEALRSCYRLRDVLQDIQTPCLLALANKDQIVSNPAIRHAAKVMPDAHLLELEDGRHEIFVERTSLRDKFWNTFDNLLKTKAIFVD